jgi:signal transduction histidine kinase
MITTQFADVIAGRMRAEHTRLAARWFDRLLELLPVGAADVFPSSTLLDHIPALITDIAGYVSAPGDEAIAANTAVLEKASELGTLRHGQRASLHQVLREYQLLGAVLVDFVQEETDAASLEPSAAECICVVSRLHEAVNALMQTTVETFVRLYNETITQQAQRLEQFARMATHEWRQPLGSLQFAVTLLRQSTLDPARTVLALDVMDRNIAHLAEMTRKIERLARLRDEGDNLTIQEVSASTIAAEAARQLREMADARGVALRVADDLPVLVVDVGRLELALLNLLSNGIKYSDPAKPVRFVEVLRGASDEAWCRVLVRDNGIGIPEDRLGSIFDRFSRAHPDRDVHLQVSGMGLGLSIVADCIRDIGGRVEVESVEGDGSTFLLTLPSTPARGA